MHTLTYLIHITLVDASAFCTVPSQCVIVRVQHHDQAVLEKIARYNNLTYYTIEKE